MITIRKERARNGMIVDPAPLNENNNAFAGTLNGDMQRDNIPLNGITADMIEAGAFNRVIADPQTTTVTLDSTSQQWQSSSGGNEIHEVTDSVDSDCVLEVEWSGGFKVTSSGDLLDAIRFHVVVNGVEVASTGWLGRQYFWGAPALSGTIPVQAGPIDVKVEAMVANVSDAIASPGLFVINGGTDTDYDVTERELVIIVRSA